MTSLTQDQRIRYTVVARAAVAGVGATADDDVIRSKCSWSQRGQNSVTTSSPVQTLHCKVRKGRLPVLNAEVTATITGPNSNAGIVLQLQDNGFGITEKNTSMSTD